MDKPVLRAFLFGSMSRGDAGPDSDIDILVELDYNLHIGLGFVDMKLDLEKLLNRKVDLISTRAVSKHLRPFIESEKQLIYERKAG
jgi:predicted nucleotidyltransferase